MTFCPAPGTVIYRRRSDTGQQIAPLHYQRSEPGRPCVVSFGGNHGFLDVLGLRSLSQEHAARIGAAMSQLFPLDVGKRSSVLLAGEGNRSGNSAWLFQFEVLRRERVSVPAGSYDAFVVKLTESGISDNMALVERAAWIVPDSFHPVRVTHRLTRGLDAGNVDWEATRIVRGGAL
ncbi:hypothetical protein [Falsiroseomonas sp.]|uniref:hypothetical protein n=1 Tax=Falsiroseomonas sp. TaxID=2870721 RepID=UPI003565A25F